MQTIECDSREGFSGAALLVRRARRLCGLSVLTGALALAGCASNPVTPLNIPGTSVAAGQAEAGKPVSFSLAFQHAMDVRARYREEMASQSGQSQNLGSGLVLVGAGIAALAAGGASRDVILGASLAGGTAYGLGMLNFDKRRLTVWSNGIKAIDCATAAVLPFNVAEARKERLVASANQLRAAIVDARVALQVAEAELVKQPLPPAAVGDAARSAIAGYRNAIDEAARTLDAADSLSDAIDGAGPVLDQTVREITAKVDDAMREISVDLSAYVQAIPSLGKYAGLLAPGAAIEQRVGDGLAKYKDAATKAQTNVEAKAGASGLQDALERLDGSVARLTPLVESVKALLGTVDVSASAAALKSCNVAGAVLPITLEPASLRFVAKLPRTQGFRISGGTPPYAVRFLDSTPDTLSIGFDGQDPTIAQVKLTGGDSQPVDYRVIVTDKSSPQKTQQLVVTIGPAPAADDTPPSSPRKAAPKPDATVSDTRLAALATRLASLRSVPVEWARLTVASAAVRSTGDIELQVSCEPLAPTSPAKPLTALSVRSALLSADETRALRDQLIDRKLLDPQSYRQLVFKPANPNCFASN